MTFDLRKLQLVEVGEVFISDRPFLGQVQLLVILHPHHLDVWLGDFTLKHGLLLLGDLDVLDLFGELD